MLVYMHTNKHRMALGPPRRSARTSNSTAVTSENNDVDPAGTEEEIHLRGSSQLPPAIPNEEDRPLIEPTGKTHWVEVPTLGMDRTPASVLTCLLKDNHPGIVDYRGKSVAASCWVHYKVAKDTSGWSAADEVEAGLWLRFRYKPEDAEEVSKHVGRCCGELLSSIKYYARIQAILDHCRNVEKVNICDKVAGRRYLTREQYVAQKPKWCDEDAWRFFADKWSNPEWVQKSETNRANRYTPGYKPHRGGSNSIATVCQKLSKKEGREVSAIEAWVYTHRGSNTLDPNSLNTAEATVCLERYKRKAIELNGESFDWLNSPVDVRALYDCSCDRPHGKWATFNGIINDREALRDIKRNRASRTAAKRQRQEEEQREKQRMIEDARRAKEYSQNMLEWGRSVHHYNTISHKFMEDMAAHTGMVWTAVPPPPPPPPPPPTYGASSSPSCENNVDVPTGMARTAVPPPPPPHPPTYGASSSPSHENAPLNRSVNGENPDDTLARIAQGMFGGYVNASSSDAGNHSPPVDDLGPF